MRHSIHVLWRLNTHVFPRSVLDAIKTCGKHEIVRKLSHVSFQIQRKSYSAIVYKSIIVIFRHSHFLEKFWNIIKCSECLCLLESCRLFRNRSADLLFRRLTTSNMDSKNAENMKLNSLQWKQSLTQISLFARLVVLQGVCCLRQWYLTLISTYFCRITAKQD